MLDVGRLAKAIVDDLNGATFARPFSARRSYLPRIELADMTAGRVEVLVVPRLVGTAPADRDAPEHTVRIDIALLCKLAEPPEDGSPEEEPENDPLLDELMNLVGALTEWFDGWEWPGYPGNWAMTTTTDPDLLDLYDQMLSESRVFLRVVTIDFSIAG